MRWIFHTIPQPGEFGYETWPPEAYRYAGGANCWGEITVDEERGIAYFPLGSPTYDYYGADRYGSNLFGNCLLALDARTGKRLWHFQTVHHDLWDYDLTSAPQLITVNLRGRKIDAVAVATKQGFVFAFDRVTGEPIWPIEEKPVPGSDVPGEKAWPTQPFPDLPPFTRQTVNPEDISDLFLSQEEYESWKIRVAKARRGLYTPISTDETIAMPGAVGGANFGNTAANPREGLFFVLSQDYPSFYKLELQPPPLPESLRSSIARQESIKRGGVASKIYCSSCHGEDLGGTVLAPSLVAIADQLNLQALSRTVTYGAGRMPPVLHIGQDEIEDILALLKDQATGDQVATDTTKVQPSGPVVASGGAPGIESLQSNSSFNRAGNDYPQGVEAPQQRYYTGYGLGFPYILKPPWTSITAYDLNEGKIRWSRPLGEDPQAVAKGVRDSGVPTGSQRNGMLVTSNGLIFSTVTNGKIYAYHADNGEILWTGEVPLGIGGLPSMYEIKGRTYIVVSATIPPTRGWNLPDNLQEETQVDSTEGSYVVFSLPST
jgi:quinoprotein glucose dehydrogenase